MVGVTGAGQASGGSILNTPAFEFLGCIALVKYLLSFEF
jgi:hypothetical protein